nr:hypothetical protein Hi04_10k_c5190_00017 [uncultured bacterium]
MIKKNHFMRCCVTFIPPYDLIGSTSRSDEAYLLFPTPVRLRIVSCKRQLLNLGAIRQHGPDLQTSRPVRLKHKMAIIRRPRGKVVAAAIVRQLHPLLAGNIHQVNIGRAWLAGAIFANPGKRKKLPVRSPVRRHRIALIRHALLVAALSLHGVDLRQAGASTDEGDLRVRFPVPHRRNIGSFRGRDAVWISPGRIRYPNLRLAPA